MAQGIKQAWTFETQFGYMDHRVTSAGRWSDMQDAAKAAAAWVLVCAENSTTCLVNVISVDELELDD